MTTSNCRILLVPVLILFGFAVLEYENFHSRVVKEHGAEYYLNHKCEFKVDTIYNGNHLVRYEVHFKDCYK